MVEGILGRIHTRYGRRGESGAVFRRHGAPPMVKPGHGSSRSMSTKQNYSADYYKVLGVDAEASEKEIKSTYRKLAQKYHPGRARRRGARLPHH